MNNYKLHMIVEYIKARGEFPFNVEDVEEDLEQVLGFFDVFEPFDEDERGVLQAELRLLALAEEEAEVLRIMEEEAIDEMAEVDLSLSLLPKTNFEFDEVCEV